VNFYNRAIINAGLVLILNVSGGINATF